jgi:hypothetical protein
MSDVPTFAELDRDGAIAEAADAAVDGLTRSQLLRRAAIGGGALVGAGALGALPALAAGKTTSGDVKILNYALTLEYLEAAFYAEAVAKGALSGETATLARVIKGHEAQHVAFLKKALGAKAVAKPTFNFKGTTQNEKKFMATSKALEDTGVAAYHGAAPMIASKAVLSAALGIHSVEARHASWIRELIGKGGNPSPAPLAFDPAYSMKKTLGIVKSTGFIVG